jgi:hypothetical protein
LWLTIWASEGLSFNTGKKLRERRKGEAFWISGANSGLS